MVTGKPVSLGGSLGRQSATGRGVVCAYCEAARALALRPEATRVVVQGFGNVGSWVAQIMTELGCKLVGVSDVSGAIHCDGGFDPNSLLLHLANGGKLGDYADCGANGTERITPDELLALAYDVLIPAALGDTIDSANADAVCARIVIEGANSPTTAAADEILNDTGVLVVPDVLVDAGGVTVSYFEWAQNLQRLSWDERDVNDRLEAKMRRAYREVEHRAHPCGVSLRVSAYELGIERVIKAGRLRGHRGYVQ